ncbi:hypothetical protein [Rhizobium leguminosarum]|uniref:hypothetical protein n=1 Tax=Rhizobium leguminosarum TaxID=384 RepID=UPI001FE01646|nr:hypothetical protein [Rhizobium leguminosarum]
MPYGKTLLNYLLTVVAIGSFYSVSSAALDTGTFRIDEKGSRNWSCHPEIRVAEVGAGANAHRPGV